MSNLENNKCKKSILCKNLEFACKKPILFMPNRRKFIPASLKGTAAVLPAITVCIQGLHLPQDEIAK